MRLVPLPQSSIRFRTELLDLLDRWTPLERFHYVDEDTCVVVCPVCGGALAVRFAGRAPRADLGCHGGCSEQEVLAALKGARR
jgi:hypothetical protein